MITNFQKQNAKKVPKKICQNSTKERMTHFSISVKRRRDNYAQVINRVNLFHTRWGQWNSRKEIEPRKIRSWLFPMYFCNWNFPALAWNAKHPLILDNL